MPSAPTYLQNFQSVIDAFGYWPDFHDAPVLGFRVAPNLIELEIEGWEMTNEVDAQGFYILTKRHVIGFEFREIVSTELEQFIPENILFELSFSTEDFQRSHSCFTVGLDSAMGSDLCGQFTAKLGAVSYVRPSGSKSKQGEQDVDGNSH